MTKKECTSCGKLKDLSEFEKLKRGYRSACKACINAKYREYYAIRNCAIGATTNKEQLEKIEAILAERDREVQEQPFFPQATRITFGGLTI